MAQERSDLIVDAQAGDPANETEQIREQIEETRSNMGETIGAIQEKLSLSNISDQISEQVNHAVETAKEVVYDATVGKAADAMKNISNELSRYKVFKVAADNPVPFLLIGAGLGLLAYRAYSDTDDGSRRTKSRSYRADYGGIAGEHGHEPLASGLKQSVGSVGKSVSGAAGGAYRKLSDAAGSAYSSAGSAVSQAKTKAEDLGNVAREQYNTYLEDNPMALGAVALALGAAVGLAIPTTSYEGGLMGEYKTELVEMAQDKASGLIDKTKEVISEVGKNVSEASSAVAG